MGDARKKSTLKRAVKRAQGSVAHFEASNFGSYVCQYMSISGVKRIASLVLYAAVCTAVVGECACRQADGWL